MVSIFSIMIMTIIGTLFLALPNVYAEEIPDWVRHNASWWSEKQIDDDTFIQGIEYLLKNNIITIIQTPQENYESKEIPDWVRHNASWWSEKQISDNEFLNSIDYLINNGIIQTNTEQTELEILLQKRADLINFIWKENTLPVRLPDFIEYDVVDKNFENIPSLKKIDKITIEMKHGINSIAYILHPKEKQHEDLMIYHHGHGQFLYTDKSQIRFLLDEGYTVLVFYMPLNGVNNKPILVLDNKEIKIELHANFALLESENFSPISYFVEPVAISLNYIDKNFNFEKYHMMGISGGGWTTVLYPAIDSRISHSYSVAGSIPLEQRTTTSNWGDYEQTLPELYEIVNYYDLYVLASFGEDRKLTQIFNQYDECCFVSEDLNFDYETEIKNNLLSLKNGEFEIIILDDAYVHHISGVALALIFIDINEKNDNYYNNLEQRTEQDFSSQIMRNHKLSVDVIDGNFVNAKIINSDLSNITLTGNAFFNSFLYNTNLTNTDISNSDFSYSMLCSPTLNNTIIHNVDLTSTSIVGLDFTTSDIKNVMFERTVCSMCNLEGIDFSEIHTAENSWGFTNFAGSNLKNIDFRSLENTKLDFSAKVIAHCEFTTPTAILGSDLTGSNFSGMDLKNIIFTRQGEDIEIINLSDVDFSFADLSSHDLIYSKLINANLSFSNLTGANLTNADLTNADLTNADLTNADLTNADLTDADLSGTILNCLNHEICNN